MNEQSWVAQKIGSEQKINEVEEGGASASLICLPSPQFPCSQNAEKALHSNGEHLLRRLPDKFRGIPTISMQEVTKIQLVASCIMQKQGFSAVMMSHLPPLIPGLYQIKHYSQVKLVPVSKIAAYKGIT